MRKKIFRVLLLMLMVILFQNIIDIKEVKAEGIYASAKGLEMPSETTYNIEDKEIVIYIDVRCVWGNCTVYDKTKREFYRTERKN